MPADPNQVKPILLAAISKPAAERAAFLDKACGADASLRERVERLLAAHDRRSGFPEPPGVAEKTGAYTRPAEEDEAGIAGVSDPGSSRRGSEGPGSRIGPYKLLQELGEGGMGTVFMADQLEPVRRKVALKVIKPGMDTKEVLARFEAERQALALMDHPNIAKVLDSGTTDSGRPYFGMELVKGVRITKYCDELQLSPRERLQLFIPVCQAIQHAHQKGIIHRDIKPSNVLVASYDGRPVPKVIDFGVAKAMGHQLTERTMFTAFGSIVGTLEYMSPEQAELNALDIDTRSDIYSLGVLLYELLTGTTPLSRKQLKQAALSEALRLIREEEPPKPSTRLSTSEALPALSAQRKSEAAKLTKMMRGELDWIVMKALDKDRSRRYETANALARDIERYLHDEPVEACPPSAGYRLRKIARKYKTPLRVASVFVLLLVVSVVASVWQAVFATQALDRAVRAEREIQHALVETKQAKTQAEKALTESEEARQQAQAVSKYLVEAFRSPDPRKEGRETKVADILDRAVTELEGDFNGSPQTKAELLDALGQTYQGLGLPGKAVATLEKARALRKKLLGPDDPDLLNTMHNLASAYHTAGRYAEAARLSETTLALKKAKLGHDDPSTLRTMCNLAYAYWWGGRNKEALPIFEQTLKLQTAKLGEDHLDTILSMNRLGISYMAANRYDEAAAIYDKALKLRQIKLGHDHPDTVMTLQNIALNHRHAGRLSEAIKLMEQTVALSKAKLGPEHPSTLLFTGHLAQTYMNAGQLEKAVPLFEETLKRYKAHLPDHPETRVTMNDLIKAYRRVGRLADVVLLFEEDLLLEMANRGADHPTTLATMKTLAWAYRDAGQFFDALSLQDEWLRVTEGKLKRQRTKSAADDPTLLQTMNSLAAAYLDAGRAAKAIPLCQEILKLHEEKVGTDNVETVRATNTLMAAYRAAGRLDEVVRHYEENFNTTKVKFGSDKSSTLAAMNTLAAAYESAGRLNDAVSLYLDALKLRTDRFGPDQPATLAVVNNLANIYETAERWADLRALRDERCKLLDEDLKRKKAALGFSNAGTLATMLNLAKAHEAAGRVAESLALQQERYDLQRANLGAENTATLKSLTDLAEAYELAGQFAKALALHEEKFTLHKEKLGPNHSTTLIAMNNFARSCRDAGELEKALELYQVLVNIDKELPTGKPPKGTTGLNQIDKVSHQNGLALTLVRMNNYAEAEPILRECLTAREGLGPDAWQTFWTKCVLGVCLFGQMNYEEAEPFLLEGYAGMKERQNAISNINKPFLTEALQHIVQLYEATGQQEEAAIWRKELEAAKSREKEKKK